MSVHVDVVVAGGGSAGVVVASRAAARGLRVLLLEPGPDQPVSPDEPNPLRDGSRLVLDGFNWDHLANLRTRAEGGTRALWARFPYRLGKVVGGSSSVNGAVAMRALPRDFDDWVRLGNPDWSWEHVRPWFDRIERDRDLPGRGHGDRGPIPIGRPPRDGVPVLDALFRDAVVASGVPEIEDLNGGVAHGVGTVPANTVDGVRMDVTATYLAAARHERGLTVCTGARVSRVLLDGTRAVGVDVVDERTGAGWTATAGEVVLSAGAVGSPTILQRSGIGPARRCATAGVTQVVDLPGVGERLRDHPSVVLWAKPVDGLCRPGPAWRQVAARVASGVGGPDDTQPDLQMWLLNNVPTSAVPGFVDRLGWDVVVGLSVMLLRPRACGRVGVSGPDPCGPPEIELGFGTSDDDVDRLVAGVRRAWRILRSAEFDARLERIQLWTDRIVDDDETVRRAVLNVMSPGWHAVGTNRMGPRTDPGAVVDQRGRVHGTSGLRVVDASVFPTMPSAPTNLTTIMLAERIAAGVGT